MRRIAILLTLSILLVAGCADFRGRVEAPPRPEFAQVLPWEAADCQYAVALIGIDADDIGGRVPEGFRILPVAEIPNFPVTQDPRTGNLGVEMFQCASGTGLNATANLTNLAYGSVFSFVEVPEALRENVTFHFLKWDVLIPDVERRALLVAQGVPAVTGNVTFSRFQDVGPLKGVQGLLMLQNDTYALDGVGQPQGTDAFQNVSFLEFSDVGSGDFVEWRTNLTSTQVLAGSGFVDLSGASWVREVVGSDRPQAYYITGMGSLTNGTISIPWSE